MSIIREFRTITPFRGDGHCGSRLGDNASENPHKFRVCWQVRTILGDVSHFFENFAANGRD